MNCYNFSKFKFRRKDSSQKREMNYICNEVLFFNNFNTFVGGILTITGLLSFNDPSWF